MEYSSHEIFEFKKTVILSGSKTKMYINQGGMYQNTICLVNFIFMVVVVGNQITVHIDNVGAIFLS